MFRLSRHDGPGRPATINGLLSCVGSLAVTPRPEGVEAPSPVLILRDVTTSESVGAENHVRARSMLERTDHAAEVVASAEIHWVTTVGSAPAASAAR